MSPTKPDLDKKPLARAAIASVPTMQGYKLDSMLKEAAKLSDMLTNGKIPRHVTPSRVVKEFAPEYARFKFCSIRSFIQKVHDTMNMQEGKYFCYDCYMSYYIHKHLTVYISMFKIMKRGRKHWTIMFQHVTLQKCLL